MVSVSASNRQFEVWLSEAAKGDKPMSELIREAAERAAENLFHNGAGDTAQRLVLTVDEPQHRDLGGLCRGAAVDRIEEVLRGALPDPATALEELAVAREALEWYASLADTDKEVHDKGGGFLTRLANFSARAEQALDAPAGKLASQVLRAAVRRRRYTQKALAGQRTAMDERENDPLDQAEAVVAATAAEDEALDAFLAVYPDFGRELT